jgi:hypothetical protein
MAADDAPGLLQRGKKAEMAMRHRRGQAEQDTHST